MRGRPVDWKQIHERISKAGSALEKGFSPPPIDVQKILKARADVLAREPLHEKDAEYIEIVEFMLGSERYGIESNHVREVYPLKDYTPLPCTPVFVLGLLNVRGRIISVIDLKKIFDLPEKVSDSKSVLIVFNDRMEFGILADSIVGLKKIDVNQIQLPLPTMTAMHGEFLRGITDERLAILDAKDLLSDKNIIVHEEA